MLITFVRTIILYLVVIIVMRLMGKRQIGQLQPFELVVAIMISELAAVPMQTSSIPLLNGIVPIVTLLLAQVCFSYINLKSIKARGIICGKPSILIHNGVVDEQQMKNEMYTVNELLEQLRSKDVANIADVEFAILETNGQLSVIPKSQKRPLNPEDLQIQTQYEGLPTDLIIDGKILEKNLDLVKLNKQWLEEKLKSQGVNNIHDVFMANLDTSGKLFFQIKKNIKRK